MAAIVVDFVAGITTTTTAPHTYNFSDVPEKPYNVHMRSCEHASTTITWYPGAPNHAPILLFILSYQATRRYCRPDSCTKTSLNFSPITLPSYQQSVTLKLLPFYNYTFSLAAENRIGRSLFVNVTNERQTCHVAATLPSKRPDDFCGGGGGSGGLKVTWKALEEQQINGPNFYYVIKYRKLLEGPEAVRHKRMFTDNSQFKTIKLYDWQVDSYVINLTPPLPDKSFLQPFVVSVSCGNKVGEVREEVQKVVYAGQRGSPSPQRSFFFVYILSLFVFICF